MKTRLSHLLCVVSLLLVHAPLSAQQPSAGLPAEERLARVEEQLARLLDEVRAIRKEIGGSGAARSRGASAPAEEVEMQQGCQAKTYVRTGGADVFSLPAPKATPSDERLEAGPQFSPSLQSKAAGYEPYNTAATIVWEGFIKVEEADVYEFLFDTAVGAAQVGPKVLSARGEKSVRLDLKPGYWPVKIHCGNSVGNTLEFRVKRSGHDPVMLTPGSLWTPKKD
ncbi:MAG: hypothetical protein JNG86_10970 [Verrucomicrobiaceae bacterium]|nr:hypothetical protein [Verrucomicrobiaceae bacterium]